MRNRRVQISEIEGNILKHIENNEFSWFEFENFRKSGGFNRDKLQDALSRLTKLGHLFRIEKGLYATRNFRNPYVIGNAMVQDGAIAYWSALNVHGLTEQIPNVVYVQSTKRKNNKKVFNVRYRFIQVKSDKICGITQMGYGNEKFRITDVEKEVTKVFLMLNGGFV